MASVVAELPEGASRAEPLRAGGADGLPVVLAHGMGDSCFNRGMQSITEDVGKHLGVYSVCIPTGESRVADTINGFLLNMDDSVDVFAKAVLADPKLSKGFNAIGFSQGNMLIRGYMQKYNEPSVNAWLSVHGTVSGVAGLPDCNPATDAGFPTLCQDLASILGRLAYNELVQNFLFQADYLRIPTEVGPDSAYARHSQLAAWNNEASDAFDTSIAENFAKTRILAMIKAEKDRMVFPNEGEWWGAFEDGAFDRVLSMRETNWYRQDLFGLKTADEHGKIFFNSTAGDHLQFSESELLGWVDQYFAQTIVETSVGAPQ
eukprot:scaffold287_cov239-Pinguiococcus_pyrenoidosus.AAC.2